MKSLAGGLWDDDEGGNRYGRMGDGGRGDDEAGTHIAMIVCVHAWYCCELACLVDTSLEFPGGDALGGHDVHDSTPTGETVAVLSCQ